MRHLPTVLLCAALAAVMLACGNSPDPSTWPKADATTRQQLDDTIAGLQRAGVITRIKPEDNRTVSLWVGDEWLACSFTQKKLTCIVVYSRYISPDPKTTGSLIIWSDRTGKIVGNYSPDADLSLD